MAATTCYARSCARTVALAATFSAALAVSIASANPVLVFAAASLTNAMADVGAAYTAKSGNEVNFSFASSSLIARQIAHGAPAEIFVSANSEWMDYLEDNNEIRASSRENLLGNQLVLVAPTDSERKHVVIRRGFPLADLLGNAYLAMGNPTHVPAGMYGKQALKSLQVWSAVKPQVARSADVRAALALVARGETRLGIVYRTDALAAPHVKIVGIFPAAAHEPIVYPAALTKAVGKDDVAARDFYKFMDSEKADHILAAYGFEILD